MSRRRRRRTCDDDDDTKDEEEEETTRTTTARTTLRSSFSLRRRVSEAIETSFRDAFRALKTSRETLGKKYDFDDQDVIKHVIYCIGTRLSSLRNMVCNTKSMHLLLSASNANQISTAIKLLQGSQGKTAKDPQE